MLAEHKDFHEKPDTFLQMMLVRFGSKPDILSCFQLRFLIFAPLIFWGYPSDPGLESELGNRPTTKKGRSTLLQTGLDATNCVSRLGIYYLFPLLQYHPLPL